MDTAHAPASDTVRSAAMQTEARAARGRSWRRVAIAVATVFVVAGLFNVWGPRQHTARVDGERHQLTVTSPSVSRGGLAASWALTVRRHDDGPLGRQLEVVVDQSYLAIFDQHALDPTPAETWTQAGTVHWLYDLPNDVTEFRVELDVRIQPDSRWRHRGSTTVHVGGESITAHYTTWLVP